MDFRVFVDSGNHLLDYETVAPYPLHEQPSTADSTSSTFYRVEKMRYAGSA